MKEFRIQESEFRICTTNDATRISIDPFFILSSCMKLQEVRRAGQRTRQNQVDTVRPRRISDRPYIPLCQFSILSPGFWILTSDSWLLTFYPPVFLAGGLLQFASTVLIKHPPPPPHDTASTSQSAKTETGKAKTTNIVTKPAKIFFITFLLF